MFNSIQPSYVPALRMKAGELSGLRGWRADVADRVLPRMVVPPPGERDQDLEVQLFEFVHEPNVADALVAHWRGRGVLLEATYLLPSSVERRSAAGCRGCLIAPGALASPPFPLSPPLILRPTLGEVTKPPASPGPCA